MVERGELGMGTESMVVGSYSIRSGSTSAELIVSISWISLQPGNRSVIDDYPEVNNGQIVRKFLICCIIVDCPKILSFSLHRCTNEHCETYVADLAMAQNFFSRYLIISFTGFFSFNGIRTE